MKIVVAIRDILDKGCWEKFCELKGINEWAVNEGQVSDDEEFYLDEEEASELGFVEKRYF